MRILGNRGTGRFLRSLFVTLMAVLLLGVYAIPEAAFAGGPDPLRATVTVNHWLTDEDGVAGDDPVKTDTFDDVEVGSEVCADDYALGEGDDAISGYLYAPDPGGESVTVPEEGLTLDLLTVKEEGAAERGKTGRRSGDEGNEKA